jgi:hypothetical protein
MNRAERTTPDLLLDNILVDAMLGSTVILTGIILGAGVQCFLRDISSLELSRGRETDLHRTLCSRIPPPVSLRTVI